MHPADELGLVVGLPHLDVQVQLPAGLAAFMRQLLEAGAAVHLRLPGAQAAQVGAVQHEHLPHRDATSPYARAIRSSAGSSRIAGRAGPSSTTKRIRAPRDFLS